jgi:cell wall-associated NlpC family hydrolase
VITAQELIEAARTWIGVPFQHQGRSRYGVDCAGFVVELMRSAGQLPYDFRDVCNYGRRPQGELLELVARHCEPVSDEQPGLLVLIRWPKDSQPSHTGLITDSTIIHCYQRKRAVVEHSFRGAWRRDMHSMWRLPGIVYE